MKGMTFVKVRKGFLTGSGLVGGKHSGKWDEILHMFGSGYTIPQGAGPVVDFKDKMASFFRGHPVSR